MRHTYQDFLKAKVIRRDSYLECILDYKSIEGYIMEFGVWEGTSINKIATRFPENNIHGFDSFEGLPEDWIKGKDNGKLNKKGTFSLDGHLPEVLPNVKLYKGWFDSTLPKWIEDHEGDVSILHIDSDLYSSAITILSLLNNQIKSGTLILFDELSTFGAEYKYSNWTEHEWKALIEWCDTYDRDYDIIARSSNKQAAIKVI